jgi:hypothetical protein
MHYAYDAHCEKAGWEGWELFPKTLINLDPKWKEDGSS